MSEFLGTVLCLYTMWNVVLVIHCIRSLSVKFYLESLTYGELIVKMVCGAPALIVYAVYHDFRLSIKKVSYIRRSLRDAIASQEFVDIH